MTNLPRIANRLARFQCNNKHSHMPLINGMVRACQVYPERFCAEFCLGLKEKLANMALDSVHLDNLDVCAGAARNVGAAST